jgi:hypothetical protein
MANPFSRKVAFRLTFVRVRGPFGRHPFAGNYLRSAARGNIV